MIKYFNRKGLSVVEFLAVCCIIFILAGTFGIYANRALAKLREVTLKHELAALRVKYRLYIILYNQKPKKLSDFFELETGRTDKNGNFIDPFGNPYIYNAKKGTIKSGTEKYSNL